MKVILATFGSYGDITPFVWMAKVLRDEGHSIVFICNPFFEEIIRKEDLDFRPAGTLEDYNLATTPANVTGNKLKDQGENILAARRLFTHMFYSPIEDTFKIIQSEKSEDILVISHFFGYGAKLAAEKYQLRYLTICLSPYWLKPFKKINTFSDGLKKMMLRGNSRFIDNQLFIKPFNTLRAKVGLQPLHKLSSEWMFEKDTLCLFPRLMMNFDIEESFKSSCVGFPDTIESDPKLPAEVSEFLDGHDKPVVFTPGSAVSHVEAFFREAVTALQQLNKPGIFLTRFKEKLPASLPENILVVDFVPLALLLDKCSAIVHHGGIGTGVQALRAGIPQLVCPRLAEQMENASVWKSMGVCEIIPFSKVNGMAMAMHLEKLVSMENNPVVYTDLKKQLFQQDSAKVFLKIVGDKSVGLSGS